MPSGLQALLALFLLLPGFVSARIVRMLSARSQQSDLERIIQALMYSFLIYVVYLGVFGADLPIEWLPSAASTSSSFQFVVHRKQIWTLGGLSLGWGIVWGVIRSYDLHMRLLRLIRVTERTSRESVWNDVMLNQSGAVQVGLGDGRIAIGLLTRYSDTGDEGSLFLRKASWITEDKSIVPIYGPGLLLTKSSDIKFVMFLEESTSQGELGDAEAEG